jgi:hypothetical protein
MTYEEIKKEYDIESERLEEALRKASDTMRFEDYMAYSESQSGYLDSLSRKMRLLQKPKFSEIPDYGDLMKISEFIECCESGGFIDYDGYGKYSRMGRISDITIYPSDIEAGEFRKDFDHVVWFNR